MLFCCLYSKILIHEKFVSIHDNSLLKKKKCRIKPSKNNISLNNFGVY